MQVLSVASEIFPLVKTGGLADVVGALPGALGALGVSVRTLVPGYREVTAGMGRAETLHHYGDLMGGGARLLAAEVRGLALLVVEAPHLYDRPGNPYVGPDGRDWPDNGLRFAALSRVAADLGQGALALWRPDVLHLHDWQAGLTAAYLAYDGKPHAPSVLTIHNLAFQGQFPPGLLARFGLPARAMSVDGVEYYGAIGFLKAGARFADHITTVSPGYAAEICTPEHGMGLDGLLRGRGARVGGILNGIDDAVWNPGSDPLIPARYDARQIAHRAVNKAAVAQRFGLVPDPGAPLFAVVSRLTWQKGMDLLLAAIPALVALGAQLAVLGSGEAWIEDGMRAAAAAYPGAVGCSIGYDEGSAHWLQAGADALLVPSRFEPCGLTQLCALRYGVIPVVARVGGLGDTVIDASPMALAAAAATGVQFYPVSGAGLEAAVGRAVALYRAPEAWGRLQQAAMATDVSWREPARRYFDLFAELVA